MKSFKTLILLLLALSFKQVKSQCPDTVKTATPCADSMTFYIYVGGNNDTVNLTIYNRWGAVVKKLLNDSVMQMGQYVITYHPSGITTDTYFYAYTSRGCTRHATLTYIAPSSGINTYLVNNYFFTLYPNPSDGYNVNIDFQASTNAQAQVIVYDMMGSAVYSSNMDKRKDINNTCSLDVSNLSQGIYMVNLVIDKVKICQKFIKN